MEYNLSSRVSSVKNTYVGKSRNKKSSRIWSCLLFVDDIYINWKKQLYSLNNFHTGSVEWALSPLHNPSLDPIKNTSENDTELKQHYHLLLYFPAGMKDYEVQWILSAFYRSHKAPLPEMVVSHDSAFKYLAHFGFVHKQQFSNGLDEIETSPYYPIPVFETFHMTDGEMLQFLIENEIYTEYDLILDNRQQARYISKAINNNKLLYSAWKRFIKDKIYSQETIDK